MTRHEVIVPALLFPGEIALGRRTWWNPEGIFIIWFRNHFGYLSTTKLIPWKNLKKTVLLSSNQFSDLTPAGHSWIQVEQRLIWSDHFEVRELNLKIHMLLTWFFWKCLDQHTEFFSYIQFSSPYCIFQYCTKNISPTSTAKISVTFNRVYFLGKIFGQDVLNFMTLLQSIDFILTLVNIIIRQHCPLAIIATFVEPLVTGTG